MPPVKLAGGVVAAIVEAIVAAVIVGVIEAVRSGAIAGRCDGETLWVLAGLAATGAAVVMLVLVALGVAIARIPGVRGWTRDLAGGGAARALAVWRAALVLVTFVVGAIAIDVIVRRAHDALRFIDGGPVGLIVTCIAAPILLVLVLGALAIDRRVLPRLAARVHLDGRRIWVAAVVAALVVACGPSLAMRLAAPAVERDVAVIAPLAIVVGCAVRLSRLGRRRVAQIAAAALALAALLGVQQFAEAERARAIAGVHGVLGRAVARQLWARADRDADGYPGAAAGGADCDDADFHLNPGRIEIPNNNVDENCSGADAKLAPAQPIASGTPAAPHRSIVVISVDALRADHLGAYGYARPTSPAIDAFAASAARFDRAYTACPSTRCAIPALLHGRYASAAREAVGEIQTLPGVLRAAGYDTAAISCCGRFALGPRGSSAIDGPRGSSALDGPRGSSALDGPRGSSALDRQHELAGFASIDVTADSVRLARPGQSNADTVADTAVEWLARHRAGAPYLLWLHFYDPHHPYAAPEDPGRFGDDDLDRYDAEIAFADRHIGRVLAAVDKDAIVVITADHGDEFGEHGIRFHARSLYSQVTRIPLLVRVPGVAPRTIAAPVGLVDLFPTLVDLVGLATPPNLSGRSLATAVRGEATPGHPVLVELVPDATIHRDMLALVSGDWKVVWDRAANAWSLYALADVEDADDRADEEPTVLADMKARLMQAIDRELVAK